MTPTSTRFRSSRSSSTRRRVRRLHRTGYRDLPHAAQKLAYNLKAFTSGQAFGRWFNGKSNFDISTDEFVVLELEHLKPQKELFKIITLQVINAVTQDLYLSDRSKNRMIIFDEAWQFIRNENNSGGGARR
jgi:conjugal transfer ATP-binding protein TraC